MNRNEEIEAGNHVIVYSAYDFSGGIVGVFEIEEIVSDHPSGATGFRTEEGEYFYVVKFDDFREFKDKLGE
jgi:hypothetical protein